MTPRERIIDSGLAATRGRFVADVYGTPDPKMSREEYERIIADAEANCQNVFFGDAWKHQAPQPIETNAERRLDVILLTSGTAGMVVCFCMAFLDKINVI